MSSLPFPLKFPHVLHLRPFQSFSGFLTRNSRQVVLFNFCGFCSSQGDPALQEDWKSTVRLGSKMSQSTLRMLLSEANRVLCWGLTLSFLPFTVAFISSVSYLLLPIPVPSFLSFYPSSTHVLFSPFSLPLTSSISRVLFFTLSTSGFSPFLPLLYFQ